MNDDLKADLIYAILAMDAYNRGYGAGIKDLGDSEGTALGGFTIYDSKGDEEAKSAGFYAIAYRNASTGETVISYRGTDAILGGDLLYGWTLGGGLATASQGQLAIDFYNAVRGGDLFDAHESTITTTGHSLGGGLAANDNDSGERAAA